MEHRTKFNQNYGTKDSCTNKMSFCKMIKLRRKMCPTGRFLRSSTFIKGVALFISHTVISGTHSETQIHIVHVKFYAYWLISLRITKYENLSLITRRNSNFHSWSLLVVPSEKVLNRWHFGNSADIKHTSIVCSIENFLQKTSIIMDAVSDKE